MAIASGIRLFPARRRRGAAQGILVPRRGRQQTSCSPSAGGYGTPCPLPSPCTPRTAGGAVQGAGTARSGVLPNTAVVSLVSRLESAQAAGGRADRSRWCHWDGALSRHRDDDVRRCRAYPRLCAADSAAVLRREMAANESLHSAIGRFVHVLLVRSMQMSVCNGFHDAERRYGARPAH